MARFACAVLCALCVAGTAFVSPPAQVRQTVDIRGHKQSLYVYGSATTGEPVIVSSGDGGWFHLAPHVAEFLGSKGFFVLGFDTKAYLESVTAARATLGLDEEPEDYRIVIDAAKAQTGKRPILIGVSEGAGLSVLAATAPWARTEISGVIGLGLPDLNELGWHLRDSVIYLTHGVPKEPTFRASTIVDRISPLPIAAIHSTHDEYVPVADIERVIGAAKEPKQLWIVNASNHRFSDNEKEFDQRLLDAIAWVQEHRPR